MILPSAAGMRSIRPRPPSRQRNTGLRAKPGISPVAYTDSPSADQDTLKLLSGSGASNCGLKSGFRLRLLTMLIAGLSTKLTANFSPSGEKRTEIGLSPPATIRRPISLKRASYSRTMPSSDAAASRPV